MPSFNLSFANSYASFPTRYTRHATRYFSSPRVSTLLSSSASSCFLSARQAGRQARATSGFVLRLSQSLARLRQASFSFPLRLELVRPGTGIFSLPATPRACLLWGQHHHRANHAPDSVRGTFVPLTKSIPFHSFIRSWKFGVLNCLFAQDFF